MEIKSCAASECARPFQLNMAITGLADPGERSRIACPHCGHVFDGGSNVLFLTHALSAEQEQDFLSRRRAREPEAAGPGRGKRVDVFRGEMSACEHFAKIYEDDTSFMDTLESFIGGGLTETDAAIVIAATGHLARLHTYAPCTRK